MLVFLRRCSFLGFLIVASLLSFAPAANAAIAEALRLSDAAPTPGPSPTATAAPHYAPGYVYPVAEVRPPAPRYAYPVVEVRPPAPRVATPRAAPPRQAVVTVTAPEVPHKGSLPSYGWGDL